MITVMSQCFGLRLLLFEIAIRSVNKLRLGRHRSDLMLSISLKTDIAETIIAIK